MAEKKKVTGAKAPQAKEDKVQEEVEAKDAQSNEEWLEEELENVEVDEGQANEDDLMKQAAKKIEDLTKEAQEWKDNYVRLHAEWDTYRRRTAEAREAEKATATEGLVSDVLPVLDDFERSISFAEENGEAGLLDGVKAVHSKLVSTLEKNGAVVIDPEEGEAFNALEHQAVATVENKQMFDESVAGVMQKGYKMGNKVIRPAMISVTTGGKKRPKDEPEEE